MCVCVLVRYHSVELLACGCVAADNGKEVLSMSQVLAYMLDNSKPVVSESLLSQVTSLSPSDWQKHVDRIRGMLVTMPGMVREYFKTKHYN